MHNSIIALAISVFLLSGSGTITEHSEVKTVEQPTNGQTEAYDEATLAKYEKETLEMLERNRESSNKSYANWDFSDAYQITLTEKKALAIGNAFLGDPMAPGYPTVTVVYDPSPDYFVVYRCPIDPDMLGGDFTVIISKKDGAILDYNVGE